MAAPHLFLMLYQLVFLSSFAAKLSCERDRDNCLYLYPYIILTISKRGRLILSGRTKPKSYMKDISSCVPRGFQMEKLTLAGFEHPEDIMDKYPFQLSGGMAQRVTIAISACSYAKLIIADEPTNGLDQLAKESFMRLLSDVFPAAAKLIITHDIAIAELCSKTLVLCGGHMMEYGPSDAVLNAPHHPYTKALISALVKNGMAETPVLRGDDGNCPFYKRCPSAGGKCVSWPKHRTDGVCDWWCAS